MTTKLTSMDKVVCRQLAARMNELLKPLAAEFNVQIRLGGGKYTEGSFSPKVEVAILNEDGQAETPDREAFRTYATMFGLDPSDLGKSFIAGGKTFVISGLKPNSYVRPILATCNGKPFKFPAEAVAKALGKPVPTVGIGTVAVA